MKNIIKYVLYSLSITALFFCSVPIHAEDNYQNSSDDSIILSFSKNLNKKLLFQSQKKLKNSEGNERYLYIPFSDNGYLIFDLKLNIISEFSTSSNNYYIDNNTDVYYLGALSYFVKNNKNYVNIQNKDDVILSDDYKSAEKVIDENIKNKLNQKNKLPLVNDSQYISGSLPNYSYNPDGICGTTSAAMLLKWYDKYVNSNYVPSNLENNQTSFIEYLRSYVDGSVPGTVTTDVYSGIISYCSSRGISHPGGYSTSDIPSYIVGRVSTYGTPYCLNLNSVPFGERHWVTGYGYTSSNGTVFAIVNDGHGHTGVSINSVYSIGIVW